MKKLFKVFTLVFASLLFFIGVAFGKGVKEMFETVVSLIVSVIYLYFKLPK